MNSNYFFTFHEKINMLKNWHQNIFIQLFEQLHSNHRFKTITKIGWNESILFWVKKSVFTTYTRLFFFKMAPLFWFVFIDLIHYNTTWHNLGTKHSIQLKIWQQVDFWFALEKFAAFLSILLPLIFVRTRRKGIEIIKKMFWCRDSMYVNFHIVLLIMSEHNIHILVY